MSPAQIFDVIFGLASTSCFLALAVYVACIGLGADAKLYAMTDSPEMTKSVRTFLSLAGVGFIVCIYKGAEFMLFWLPINITSEGERITAASVVAMIFAIIAGPILIQHIIYAHKLAVHNHKP